MVIALGGIFIYSENPKSLAEWYSSALGISYEYTETYKAFYVSFPYTEAESEKKRYTAFSILYNDRRPFLQGKAFTINLRVDDLEETVKTLNSKQVAVRGIEVHDEGKFAWLNDPEGNYIELWEDVG